MKQAIGQSGGRRGQPWRIAGWGFAGLLLLLPLVAMQFTAEVDWTAGDFVFAGIALGGVGALFELALRRSADMLYRCAFAAALVSFLLLVWITGAVGIIGDEGDPANLVYPALVAAAAVGIFAAGFEPRGMARAMFAAAFLQPLWTLYVLAQGLGAGQPPGAIGILLINGFFAVAWFVSGALFRMAANRKWPTSS